MTDNVLFILRDKMINNNTNDTLQKKIKLYYIDVT